MKAIYNQFIGIYKNAFSKSFCDHLINKFNSNIHLAENRLERDGEHPLNIKDTSVELEKIDSNLSYQVKYFLETEIIPIYSYKFNLPHGVNRDLIVEGTKLQKTLPTEGFHGWHFEHGSSDGDSLRVMAYTLYLNDIEEGGETEFLNQSLRIPSTTGTLCIFPSSFTHTHRGNPPLSGEKYILTGWVYFKEGLQ